MYNFFVGMLIYSYSFILYFLIIQKKVYENFKFLFLFLV